ncbi:MAG: archease [Planctomycetota bacterium]
MSKHCETFDHTADVGLTAQADTLGELFEALGEGLADVICPPGQVADREKRTVSVDAEDVEALLVDFLSKIMVTIQTDRFVAVNISVKRMSETAVEADIAGERYDPQRHEIRTEVKAVTYHQLRVAREGKKWTGRVILDI